MMRGRGKRSQDEATFLVLGDKVAVTSVHLARQHSMTQCHALKLVDGVAEARVSIFAVLMTVSATIGVLGIHGIRLIRHGGLRWIDVSEPNEQECKILQRLEVEHQSWWLKVLFLALWTSGAQQTMTSFEREECTSLEDDFGNNMKKELDDQPLQIAGSGSGGYNGSLTARSVRKASQSQ